MFTALDPPCRPPVLCAATELGFTTKQVAPVLGLTRGSIDAWSRGSRRMRVQYRVGLAHVLRAVLDRAKRQPPLADVRRERLRQATMAQAQRWLGFEADDLPPLEDWQLDRGLALGRAGLALLGIRDPLGPVDLNVH
jgi:hypothetical protein